MPLSLNPIQRCNDTLWPTTWKGRHSTFHLLDQFRRGQRALLLVGGLAVRSQSVDYNRVHWIVIVLHGGRYDIQLWNECGGTKSFVDDLMFCRGDVSIRAAITLRGIESYPYLT